jgi:NAD(P)-dependent dehydrogenase (short-subunit alcohol dehydrogenase family)
MTSSAATHGRESGRGGVVTAAAERTVVVTGASSGIGHALVARLAAEGWHVFATVRRAEDATALGAAFGSAVTALIADVTDVATLSAARASVTERLAGRPLGALLVNAGIALPGPLLHQPLDEIRQTLDVNVLGAIATVQAFAPLMMVPAPETPGRIVAISSVSGKIAAPFVGAYAASKHALEAACDSLRRELMIHGIDVIMIEPGPIATPIWRKSAASSRYEDTAYRDLFARMSDHIAASEASALPVVRVADAVMTALTARRPRTRYPVVRNPLINWLLPRMLPDRVLDRVIARQLRLKRRP